MHGASFRPRILAGYALRALSWHDLRSVRSFLHARSAFPASFRGFRHARSAIPVSGMHGARFPPRPVAGYALCVFPHEHEHARRDIPAKSSGAICAPCIPPLARACTERHSGCAFWLDIRSVHCPGTICVPCVLFCMHGARFLPVFADSGTHGARFPPRSVAGYALCVFSRQLEHARGAMPALTLRERRATHGNGRKL